jgi:hypothetical protein
MTQILRSPGHDKYRGHQDITTDPHFVSSLKKINNMNIWEEDRFQTHVSQYSVILADLY